MKAKGEKEPILRRPKDVSAGYFKTITFLFFLQYTPDSPNY